MPEICKPENIRAKNIQHSNHESTWLRRLDCSQTTDRTKPKILNVLFRQIVISPFLGVKKATCIQPIEKKFAKVFVQLLRPFQNAHHLPRSSVSIISAAWGRLLFWRALPRSSASFSTQQTSEPGISRGRTSSDRLYLEWIIWTEL